MYPSWSELDKDGIRTWPQLPLGILPNILGFSMGGMAIVLAFAGSRFIDSINEGGKDNSYFIKLVATFFHFIIAQTTAILLGLAGKSYNSSVLSFIGYFAMVYSILAAVSTAGQLFNTARIANVYTPEDEP